MVKKMSSHNTSTPRLENKFSVFFSSLSITLASLISFRNGGPQTKEPGGGELVAATQKPEFTVFRSVLGKTHSIHAEGRKEKLSERLKCLVFYQLCWCASLKTNTVSVSSLLYSISKFPYQPKHIVCLLRRLLLYG